MALDRQTQEQYIRVIHRLWPTMQHYTADDVNEEVARIVFTCIQDIDRASQGIAAVHELVKGLKDWFKADGWNWSSQWLIPSLKLLMRWRVTAATAS